MKQIYKILAAIVVIVLIFFAGFYANKYYFVEKRIPQTDTVTVYKPKIKHKFDTITEIDTIAKYLLNLDTVFLTDTIFKTKIDTIIAYLKDYDTKKIYDTTFEINQIKFSHKQEIYRNRIIYNQYKFKNLKISTSKAFYIGGGVMYYNKPYLLISAGYAHKKSLFGMSLNKEMILIDYKYKLF